MAESCSFCDIVAGRLAPTVVYADEDTIAFLDQRQFHPGHVLVIPRRHIADIREADEHIASVVMATVARVARAVDATFPSDGLSIWHSAGVGANQEVPHLHVHVHPRRVGDGMLLIYPQPPAYPDHETLERWGAQLRDALLKR